MSLKFYGKAGLSKIASLLGRPLATYRATQDKSKIKLARVLIEIYIRKEFPKTITFMDQKGEAIIQEVEFEWRTIRCTH